MEEIHEYWTNLPREEAYCVCGKPANEIDEDWIYCVYTAEGKPVTPKDLETMPPDKLTTLNGTAYLNSLKPLCKECHLAKHQGYVLTRGKHKEAIIHLAQTNKTNLKETITLVNKAFAIHEKLNRIRNWTIKLGKLDMPENTRISAETFLNKMYKEGYFIIDPWLFYHSPKNYTKIKIQAAKETLQILKEALEKVRKVSLEKITESLTQIVYQKLKEAGIKVYTQEFKLLWKIALKEPENQKMFRYLLTAATQDHDQNQTKILAAIIGANGLGLTGKWFTFLPPAVYTKAFKSVLDRLKKQNIDYSAKIIAHRKEYRQRELPLIIYTPSPIALQLNTKTLKTIQQTYNQYGIQKPIYYKPDLYTKAQIYSKT